MAKFCSDCGSGVSSTAKFCEDCGVALVKTIDRDGPREVEVKNVVYTKKAPEGKNSQTFGIILIVITITIVALIIAN